MTTGDILGLHHIKVPVTDLARSRLWYERVFEVEPQIEFPDDELNVEHSPVIEATVGWMMSFKDPDGLELRFYTADRHGDTPRPSPGAGRVVN
ncbi:MAG: hypothetical protein JO086_00290 [Acidimicrobiia bacterium]|nr:hypothetical protein [Acidimicrobiia bacterium]